MDSVIEYQRNLHEERERLTNEICEESLLNKPTRREKINSDLRTKNYQARYKDVTIKLNNLYTDKTRQRKQAIQFMNGVNHKGNPMKAFLAKYDEQNEKYEKLTKNTENQIKGSRNTTIAKLIQQTTKNMTPKDIEQGKIDGSSGALEADISAYVGSIYYEFHELEEQRKILHKGTKELTDEEKLVFKKVMNDTSKSQFSAEEGYGKYIDLHDLHLEFLNLKGIDKNTGYLAYLGLFDDLSSIEKSVKRHKNYKVYLENLFKHLSHYVERVMPLYDQPLQFTKLSVEFNEEWNQGTFKGWQRAVSGSMMKKQTGSLNMEEFEDVEELKVLGLDRLKEALKAVGLKCGGDLNQRATRLFATKHKNVKDLPKKWRISEQELANLQSDDQNESTDQKYNKTLAWLEAKIYNLSNLINVQIKDTQENVRRKQGKTSKELAEEEEDESDEEITLVDNSVEAFTGENEEEVIYNPKNLPLDWDGKPIPYWLYKLHGLNKNYPCEICGGFSYRGLKPYQKHFAEWRHAHGMRCLGIPNTVHFSGIVKIEDAQKLWSKLKAEKTAERFKPETEEEFEDQVGNVLNKKTFDDLRRQGLC